MTDTFAEGVPRDPALDSTLALLSRGYTFIAEGCRRNRADAFETRLMLRGVVCTLGEDAARMFYEPGRFTRRGAMPETTLRLLQDRGSVQQLDGEAHDARKRLFLALMTPEARQRLLDIAADEWDRRLAEWPHRDRIVLLWEVEAILCAAVCRWAGVPLADADISRRTRQFAETIAGAGGFGPRTWRALWLRGRSESWLRGIVREARSGHLAPGDGTALYALAVRRDVDGGRLDVDSAAVELHNVIRPTVAVARFVMFAALALHQHPKRRIWLRDGGDQALTLFAHEVRRFYPFFPAVGGRVRVPFEWHGRRFREGDWVLLDLYGTNHDPRIWEDPERFWPERFRDRRIGAFELVPQGAGEYQRGHRCPGEGVTIDLLKQAVARLAGTVDYEVPEQDLTVDLRRMPAQPASGFVIAKVRPAG